MKSLFKTFWGKFRWHLNEFLIRHPALLASLGIPLTVVDAFGAPGDTLLTAIVCRELKKRHPRLKLDCSTPNPSLLELDPNIRSLNRNQTFCSISFTYLDLLQNKDAVTNVLKSTMTKLGLCDYQYHAKVYLSHEELQIAKKRVEGLRRPIVTINAMSKEMVKVWPLDYWKELTARLCRDFAVVQLGDDREPRLPDVLSLGGKLSQRESMAVLSLASVHIGPDSFLMHAANGLDVPSVIIYGGSRPPACLGYPENENLYVQIDCSPCWLHDSHGDLCPYEIKCMRMVSPDIVFAAVERKLALGTP